LATVAGDTDLLFANTGVFLSQIKAGKLRALGVAATKRLSVLPDVPTFIEMGYAGFESASFYGLAAPARTPRPIVTKLYETLAKIINSPESMARMDSNGAFPVANTPSSTLNGCGSKWRSGARSSSSTASRRISIEAASRCWPGPSYSPTGGPLVGRSGRPRRQFRKTVNGRPRPDQAGPQISRHRPLSEARNGRIIRLPGSCHSSRPTTMHYE